MYELCIDIWFSVYPMIEVQEERDWGKCSSGLGFKCQDSCNLAGRMAFSIWQDQVEQPKDIWTLKPTGLAGQMHLSTGVPLGEFSKHKVVFLLLAYPPERDEGTPLKRLESLKENVATF